MKIYIDYDSTLVDFNGAYLKIVNNKLGTNYTTHDITSWNFVVERHGKGFELWRHKGFYEHVFPIPQSQWFVETLRLRYGKKNVVIITSTSSEASTEAKAEKHAHIKYYYNFDEKNIIHADPKHPHTQDGILIDDYIKHIDCQANYNIKPGILFNYKESYGWCPHVDTNLIKTFHDYPSILDYLKIKFK